MPFWTKKKLLPRCHMMYMNVPYLSATEISAKAEFSVFVRVIFDLTIFNVLLLCMDQEQAAREPWRLAIQTRQ